MVRTIRAGKEEETLSDICCRQFSQSAAALQKADDDDGNDVTARNSDSSHISLTCTLLSLTLLDPFSNS